jgi:hypothetical protein
MVLCSQYYSLLPLATLSSHIILAISLTVLVCRTIYRSYLVLPPSSATRHRQPARKTNVRLFSILAAVSLLLAVYWRATFGVLSYRVWASERGVTLPEG